MTDYPVVLYVALIVPATTVSLRPNSNTPFLESGTAQFLNQSSSSFGSIIYI